MAGMGFRDLLDSLAPGIGPGSGYTPSSYKVSPSAAYTSPEFADFARAVYLQGLGKGESAAEAQLKREAESGARRAMAMAKSQTGLTDAARLRMANMAGAEMQAAAQAKAAEARILEEERARQAYAQLLAGQDAAMLGREQLSAQQQIALNQAMLDKEQLDMQRAMFNAQQSGAALNKGLGMLGSGITTLAAFSDKRTKKNVRKIPGKIADEFLAALQGSSTWEYKKSVRKKHPDKTVSGRSAGPMAQDLAKTKIGKDLVEKLDGRLALNLPKVLTASLAGLGRISERLSALEG